MIHFDENALQQVAQGTPASPLGRSQRSRQNSIPFRKPKGTKEEVQKKLADFVALVRKQQSPKIADPKAAAAAVVESAGDSPIVLSGLAKASALAAHLVAVPLAEKDVLVVAANPTAAAVLHSQLTAEGTPCRLISPSGEALALPERNARVAVVMDAESLLSAFLGGVCARLSAHFSHLVVDRSRHVFPFSIEMLLARLRAAIEAKNAPQIFISGTATARIATAMRNYFPKASHITFPFATIATTEGEEEVAEPTPTYTVLTEDDAAFLGKTDVASPPQGRDLTAALREAPAQQQAHALVLAVAVLKALADLHTDDTAPLVVQIITGNSRHHEAKLTEMCSELPIQVSSKYGGPASKITVVAVVTSTPITTAGLCGRHAIIDLGTEYVIRPGTAATPVREFELLCPKGCWALRENIDQRRALCDQTALWRSSVLGEKSDCLYVQLYPSEVIKPASALDPANTADKKGLFQEYAHPSAEHADLLRMDRLNMTAAVMVPYLPSAVSTHRAKNDALGFTNKHGFSIKGDLAARLTTVLNTVEIARFATVATALGLAEEGLAVAVGMAAVPYVKGKDASSVRAAREALTSVKSDHIADAILVATLLDGFPALKTIVGEAIGAVDASGCGAVPQLFANARRIVLDYAMLPAATTSPKVLIASIVKNAPLLQMILAESFFFNAAAGRTGRHELRLILSNDSNPIESTPESVVASDKVATSELVVTNLLHSKPGSYQSASLTCLTKNSARLGLILFHESIDIARDPTAVFVGLHVEGRPYTVEVKGDLTFNTCISIRQKIVDCFGLMQTVAWLGGGSNCTVNSVQAAINRSIDVASLQANTRQLILDALPLVEVADTSKNFVPTDAHSLIPPLWFNTKDPAFAKSIFRHKPECSAILPQLWAGIEAELAASLEAKPARAPHGAASKAPTKTPAAKKGTPAGKSPAPPVARKQTSKQPPASTTAVATAAPPGFCIVDGKLVPEDLIESDDEGRSPVNFDDDE